MRNGVFIIPEPQTCAARQTKTLHRMPTYEWSQTKEDLTLQVPFPPSTPASSIVCTVSQGRLVVGLRGAAPIVDGELFDPLSSHVWSLEGGNRLTLELEKARPRYWPWVLRGDPEVDVAALKARDKLESEPAYKPHPGEHAHPLRAAPRRPALLTSRRWVQMPTPCRGA